MPVSELLKSPFNFNNSYHLVFKCIDGLLLYKNANDYTVFLERFYLFTHFVFDTWAFCQLNNHAHFIINVKKEEEIIANIKKIDAGKQTVAMKKLLESPNDQAILDEMIERQINSFMVSFVNYAKNKYQHNGGLFQKPFKRILIDDDTYLQQAIIYVHANPIKHKICNDYKTYLHSSYQFILNKHDKFIHSFNTLQFFGGLSKFIELHEAQISYYYKKGFPNSKSE